ncbi:HesA/MoeB/ThiF family protein [Sulfurospirillum barnesii]|uniref:Dinucleotide-utilizing enzyme possibly involved in molybdopterin or thiamin biosynthesis n=1 Tax=Sulfurospirillum barnesii (strain ATCC 700032 / DSM 10660 / SES-3) TaxID=760154 RepID=I3XYN8_SULBS|nr:HesA/MoeB/ThiF family protein [Sulfurospirillum barnesii]AFL69062.1 dinucleotide-utilizing enzyme possibly involved in molybdopterin or thiamin biosynthesis [Sulfurospirillum barnesii SES-3]
MERLDFLRTHLEEGFLPLKTSFEAMKRFTCNFRDIEEEALKAGILPLRYKRNQKTISTQEQYTLFQSHVVIIGCGGLGGFVSEMLTRIGIGRLTLIDGDVFEEHNLNRQNFSTTKTLGRFKAEVVKENLEAINPALHVKAISRFFDPHSDTVLLKDADVVVDALDNPDLKCALADLTQEEHKAFVHGAIAGYYSQFASCTPLHHLYKEKGDGVEKKSGNPSFTVCFAAAIQSTEVIKLLLGKPHLQAPLMGDLWEYELISL